MALSLKLLKERSTQECKKSLYLIPYFFTFANALCGFLCVHNVLEGEFFFAACFIFLAACMDMFDGRVARALNCSSCLGAELDALCDAVSFCFAPVILFSSMYLKASGNLGLLVLAGYLCAGLFRLARFNVLAGSHQKYFSGLPTPVAACFLASVVLYHQWFTSNMPYLLTDKVILWLVAGIASLMVSTVQFSSFKQSKPNFIKYYRAYVAAGSFIVVSVIFQFPVIAIGLAVYIASSLVLMLISYARYFLKKVT